ncbi:MAG TPA: helix-turn-helix transcriptional regulator [Candidatus Cloacimonadota bacterium]|nr:helix-turn-helix transcriptional regulator [Candidatus Cloacimonadota bacterium]
MESLGQYLKGLREEQHLTLEEVNRELKLSEEQITVIENNQLSKLGDYGFARATVYTYSRYLGADEKITFNLFDSLMPSRTQNSFKPHAPIKEKKVLISVNFIWTIIIIIIVIILSAIIWTSYKRGYLKRPFEQTKQQADTILTQPPAVKQTAKPDTVREHLLKIAAQAEQNPPSAKTKETINPKLLQNSLKDTSDYVNELIFEGRESPFNPKN